MYLGQKSCVTVNNKDPVSRFISGCTQGAKKVSVFIESIDEYVGVA